MTPARDPNKYVVLLFCRVRDVVHWIRVEILRKTAVSGAPELLRRPRSCEALCQELLYVCHVFVILLWRPQPKPLLAKGPERISSPDTCKESSPTSL